MTVGSPFEEEFSSEAFQRVECDRGVRHDHNTILQRNAKFLLESSKKISTYDPCMLDNMQLLYDRERYTEVIDLAYSHDRKSRMEQHTNKSPGPLRKLQSFVSNVLSLLSQ